MSRIRQLQSAMLLILWLLSTFFTCGCSRTAHKQGSSSMSPTIGPGQTIIINHAAYRTAAIHRWEVVAFIPPSFPKELWISRVVGLPGERISITNGRILVNNKEVVMPVSLKNLYYTESTGRTGEIIHYPVSVPTNAYFLLGDNSTLANDSRYIGPIATQRIVGQVETK